MNNDLKKKLVAAGICAIPILMVQITSALLSESSPQQASAAVPVPAVSQVAVPVNQPLKPDGKSVAATEHIAYLSKQPFGQAPFHYRTRNTPVKVVENTEVQLRIQMIMVTQNGNVATINGKEYRVGQRVEGTQWFVKKINGQDQSVTLLDSSTGKSITGRVNPW